MKQLKLDSRFQKRIRGTFEKYEFEVGIIDDKEHRVPLRGEAGKRGQDVLTSFAGTKVRKASRKLSGTKLSEISKANRERYDYLRKPFQNQNTDIARLIKVFFQFAFGKSERKRLENTLQAVVRNPILKKRYGTNSSLTQKIKGFDHVMMDTAQFFKAIRARVKVKRV